MVEPTRYEASPKGSLRSTKELPRLGSAGRKCTHSYAFVLDSSSNPEQIPTYARTSVQHSQRIGIKADLIGCARSLTVGAQGGRRGRRAYGLGRHRALLPLFRLVGVPCIAAFRRVAKPTASPQQSPVTKFLGPRKHHLRGNYRLLVLPLTLSSAVH